MKEDRFKLSRVSFSFFLWIDELNHQFLPFSLQPHFKDIRRGRGKSSWGKRESPAAEGGEVSPGGLHSTRAMNNLNGEGLPLCR